MIYTDDFTSPDHFGIPTYVATEFTTYNGQSALKITAPDSSTSAYHLVNLTYGNIDFRRHGIRFTCWMASEGVSKPPQEWLGIKFMYRYKRNGADVFPGHSGPTYGDNDWTELTFDLTCDHTCRTIEGGTLQFGLQEATGTVYFSNLTITMYDILVPSWNVSDGFRCEYSENVTSRGRARGAMSPTQYSEEDFKVFKSWNGNLFRWQLSNGPQTLNLTLFDEWLAQKLDELEIVLRKAEELKIWILIACHTAPGSILDDKTHRVFVDPVYGDHFIEMWRGIARRFKDFPMLWGYDLLNEPMSVTPVYIHPLDLLYNTVQAVREIDPYTPIIVSSDEQGIVSTFYRMQPFPFRDIIYQVHEYNPGSYTHQGVGTMPDQGYEYPGSIDGTYWNREALAKDFQYVIDFEKQYGAKIYIGEFSAIRWATGCKEYVADVISVAEEHNWDWSYHSFREWHGWSVEHDNNQSNLERLEWTERKQLLIDSYAPNKDATARLPPSRPKRPDGGIIAAAVISSLVVLSIIIVLVVCLVRRKSGKA